MKTSKSMLLAAAALLSFSCAKENLKETETPASSDKNLVEMTFNAFAGEETKTAVGEKGEDGKYPVNWVSTDKIAIMDNQSDIYEFNYVSGEGTKATFSGKVTDASSEYYAVYPYMDFICDGEEYGDIILPQDQNEFASNISSGIMVAKADTDNNLKFKNVTAFIKITIPEGITHVSFEGANKETITGTLSFKFDGTTVSDVSAKGLNATYAYFGDMKTELKAGTYYLAVAPVALKDGFIVEYVDVNGKEKKEIGTKDPNLAPGKIVNLGSRDPFKPVELTRGDAWEWTATVKTWSEAGKQTIQGHDWDLSSDNSQLYFGYATNGQQLGSKGAPAKSVSLSSNYGETYGIDEVVVNASYASGSDATLEVSVGGKEFVCENETSVSLTTSATEYTFKSSELVAGDIVIKYTQTTAKAMYLKAIFINPVEKTQLATPANLKASVDETVKNKINVSWDAVENAGSYNVTCSGVDAQEVTSTSASFENLDWSTDYTITVTAKIADGDAAHLDSDAAISEKISIGASPVLTLSDESKTVASDETKASFDITSNLDWTVSTDADWITDWTKSGSNDGTVSISFSANTTGAARTATFTVKSADNTISKTVKLTQKAAGTTTTVTDVLTAADFAATTTTYKNFSNVKKNSTAVYAGNSAQNTSKAIQMRSTNNSGIVTTTSGGNAKSVKITIASGNKTIDVYGSNTAYTGASDLYTTGADSTKGTKIGSLSKTGTITIEGSYKYIGIRSNSGAVYISSIEIVWE